VGHAMNVHGYVHSCNQGGGSRAPLGSAPLQGTCTVSRLTAQVAHGVDGGQLT
jgi:hypothetical protein